MAQELLFAGIAEEKDFITFIKDYQPLPDSKTLMLLEIQPRYVVAPEQRQGLLLFAPFQTGFDVTPYTAGRIFHNDGELRWERLHSLVHIVYTGNAAYTPAVKDMQKSGEEALDDYDPTTRKYFLFGKRLDKEQIAQIGPAAQEGDFAEVRIPRLLRYPPIDAERVQIAVCEYIHRTTGANSASRFYDLVPFSKSKEQKSA